MISCDICSACFSDSTLSGSTNPLIQSGVAPSIRFNPRQGSSGVGRTVAVVGRLSKRAQHADFSRVGDGLARPEDWIGEKREFRLHQVCDCFSYRRVVLLAARFKTGGGRTRFSTGVTFLDSRHRVS